MMLSRRPLVHLVLLTLLPGLAVGGAGLLTAVVFLGALVDAGIRIRAEEAGRRLAGGDDPMTVADETGALLVHRTSGLTIVPGHWEGRIETSGGDVAAFFAQILDHGVAGGVPETVAPGAVLPVGWTKLEDPSWTILVPVDRSVAATFLELPGSEMTGLALILVGTGFMVSILLLLPRQRMIEDLTQAADEVKTGGLAPWFPPPVDGEVGRLSLATSDMVQSMADRLKDTAQRARMAAVGELSIYLAHEIRTPLSSIRLSLQSLDRSLRTGRLPDDAPEVLTLCLEEIGRLDNVAGSVLEMGRAPADGSPEESHVHPVLQRAVDVIRPRLELKGIEPVLKLCATNDKVLGDGGKLRGVFLAILMNGAEAMPEGGRIEIVTETIRGAERDRRSIRIRFTDDGSGVPPEIRERLFDPFFTTKAQGSGVGLPLALQTVQALGGRLYLNPRSELLPGAEFLLELPLLESHGSIDPFPPSPAEHKSPP